jgi:uncharacterized 2Fe-2S/4Fe-4S cluster protein (DUF4445 family)
MDKLLCAVDVGTTTVAVSFINKEGVVLIRDGFLNPQKCFGSDVISRITNAGRGDSQKRMQSLLLEQLKSSLLQMLGRLFPRDGSVLNDDSISTYISRICISANTVMASILLDRDISKMGQAPFAMPFTENTNISLFGVPTLVLAGASAFLGGDSLVGAGYLGLANGEILMDLGTNGEIILRKDDCFHGATAACGPAFENCTRSMGIQGSTTLGVISNLMKRGKLRRDGVLTEEFIAAGMDASVNGSTVHLTSDILRSIQLAIAALYSTLVLLMKEAGLPEEQVEHLYISGGFGFYMNLSDGAGLGLFPCSLLPKAKVTGNTSLEGAMWLLQDAEHEKEFENLRTSVMLHQYGGSKVYEELFVNSLILTKR